MTQLEIYANTYLFSRSVVSSLCIGLAETINKVGPVALEGREH